MLHRLRRAMVRPDRELLVGEVEVDESHLSLTDRKNPISSKNRKSRSTKVLVVIAVEIHHPKGFGRIRIRRIEKGDYEHLMPFIEATIRPGNLIHSDGSPVYKKLKEAGYEHRRSVHLGSDIAAHESMPGVHRVAALLQRWLLGTHHGAIQPKQLDYYLDEFVFRFNRRSSKYRGLLFYRLLQQAVVTHPVTYGDVTKGGEKEQG
jgi:transposase-like protein